MKMDGRFNEQDDSTSTQENVAGSPLSGGDEATEEVYEPSPKKRFEFEYIFFSFQFSPVLSIQDEIDSFVLGEVQTRGW